MPRRKNLASFEGDLSELETLVSHLESSELSLEESLQAFEKGVKLVAHCQQILKSAEQKINTLSQDKTPIANTPTEPEP